MCLKQDFMIRVLIVFVIIILILPSGKAQGSWELIKQSDNIKVYIKEAAKNEEYINIKAETYTKGNIQSFAAVMNDVANYTQWMHSVNETYIVSRKGHGHFSYYMLTDFPWPAKDRDAVINLEFEWIPERKLLKTNSKNVEGLIPEKDGIRRVDELDASYSFMQFGDQVKIEYVGKIRPGVELPDWIMEKVYHIAPYNTLKNLKEFAARSKYKNSRFNLEKLN